MADVAQIVAEATQWLGERTELGDLWEELGEHSATRRKPVTLRGHAGRFRSWQPENKGKGRPSYKGLHTFLEHVLMVGQELCLEADTPAALMRHVDAAKGIAKLLHMTLEWGESEEVVLRVEHNPNVTARQAWVTRRVVVHRAYALVVARLVPLRAAEGTRLY